MKRSTALLATCLASCFAATTAPAADLLAVYQRALQNDPQLKEAEATRLAALEAKPQAVAALLPQLNGTGTAQRERDTGPTNETQVVTAGPATTGGTGEASTCLLPVMVTADEPGDPNAAPPVGSDRAIVKLRVPAKGDAVLTATVKLLVDVSFFAQVSVPPALV